MSASHAHQRDGVSLVIPGRNCAQTIRQCLAAVVPLLEKSDSRLAEIIFVDDNSTDATASVVRRFESVRRNDGPGRGPGAARNTGWRAARCPFIWFVDADCVAEPEALALLLPHMQDQNVGGVSGSYGIMNEHSLLARLIHEEIIQRHRRMGLDVNFLATFNVLYRQAALERVDGFDERYRKGQDAELSFRVQQAGWRLRFELASRVKHFHEQRLWRYLNTQMHQGLWRVYLHLEHRGHARGDSYSNWSDHMQPPLAMLALASCALPIARALWPAALPASPAWTPVVAVIALAMLQWPMTARIVRRTKEPSMLLFAPMSFLRAFARGLGLCAGLLRYLLGGLSTRKIRPPGDWRPSR